MAGEALELLREARRWLKADSSTRLAVAVVVRTWRSSPRQAGSFLFMDEAGRFEGSVSGGCVESAVLQLGAEVLVDGEPRRVQYGVTQEQAWAVGLPCGGTIVVWVLPLPEQVVAKLLESLEVGQPTYWAIRQPGEGGRADQVVWSPTVEANASGPGRCDETLPPLVAELGKAPMTGLQTLGQGEVFVHQLQPPGRVYIVGAVHLAQVLVPLALRAGFQVSVIDPRSAYLSEQRFPEVRRLGDWPDAALRREGLDAQSAVVVLAHDQKLDDPALSAALDSPCFYIGALGSRRTQEARRRRLTDAGYSTKNLDRIYGPVGLSLGGRAPFEIAISVIAEIVSVRRGGRAHRRHPDDSSSSGESWEACSAAGSEAGDAA